MIINRLLVSSSHERVNQLMYPKSSTDAVTAASKLSKYCRIRRRSRDNETLLQIDRRSIDPNSPVDFPRVAAKSGHQQHALFCIRGSRLYSGDKQYHSLDDLFLEKGELVLIDVTAFNDAAVFIQRHIARRQQKKADD